MTKIVRDVIKGTQISKQDVFEKKKEEFEPITEQLEKEIDEISNLREEYQKKQIIPYSGQVKQLTLQGPEGEQPPKIVSDMNKGFTEDELGIIQKHQLPLPSTVLIDTLKDATKVQNALDKSGQLNIKLGLEKAHLSTTKTAKKKNKDKITEYSEEIDAIQKYRKRTGVIEEGTKTLKIGKGIYTQTKRNAYKINPESGAYGNLTIDVPKLWSA